jgi:hypothetical protein
VGSNPVFRSICFLGNLGVPLMLGWKLLAIPGVVLFAGLLYFTYDTFLETSSSEEQAADGPTTTSSATPVRTRSPTPGSTAPLTPSPAPTAGDAVLVGAGDISSCTQTNDYRTAHLLDSVIASANGEVIVFTAGDNAYEYGTLEEYQQCYDPTWGRHKARTRPAAGNHEYSIGNAEGYFSYFGVAAGDPGQGYYSYELGAWHIIVLNTSNHCLSATAPPLRYPGSGPTSRHILTSAPSQSGMTPSSAPDAYTGVRNTSSPFGMPFTHPAPTLSSMVMSITTNASLPRRPSVRSTRSTAFGSSLLAPAARATTGQGRFSPTARLATGTPSGC